MRALLTWIRRLLHPVAAPFVGDYRTRYVPPAEPAAKAPSRPRSARREAAWQLLVSLGFVAGGTFMALHPRDPLELFYGLGAAAFFGLCAWVFVEQLAAGGATLSRAAGMRAMGFMAGTGTAGVAVTAVLPELAQWERFVSVMLSTAWGGLGVAGMVWVARRRMG